MMNFKKLKESRMQKEARSMKKYLMPRNGKN
jgi:hypothetical protein